MVCFNLLGPADYKLNYWASISIEENKGIKKTFSSRTILSHASLLMFRTA